MLSSAFQQRGKLSSDLNGLEYSEVDCFFFSKFVKEIKGKKFKYTSLRQIVASISDEKSHVKKLHNILRTRFSQESATKQNMYNSSFISRLVQTKIVYFQILTTHDPKN